MRNLAPADGCAPEEGPWGDDPQGWFIAGYGPTRRISGHSSTAQGLMRGPSNAARLVTLFLEDASLAECLGWLQQINYRKLEGKAGYAEVERAVLDLLNDGLLPDGIRVEEVTSEGLWTRRNGLRLPLGELSDGYRTVAALVLDLYWSLIRAHGDDELPRLGRVGGGCYVPYEGVVLIDEADLHLHVSWQQRIGFWLKEHFPNLQFIVTSHSPFICQAADPGGLIRLPAADEEQSVEQVDERLYHTIVNGSADDAVLTELFGLERPYSERSEAVRARLAELEGRVGGEELSAADRHEIEALRKQLPRGLSADVARALRQLTLV